MPIAPRYAIIHPMHLHRAGRTRGRLATLIVLLHILPLAIVARGQTSTPAIDASQQFDPSLTTLHVYTTRLQTAVLVVGDHGEPLKIAPDQFRLRLDRGKPFVPASIHRADEDPLSLAILLDLSAPRQLPAALAQAIGSLREGPLGENDRVQLYGVDCAAFRANATADTPESLAHGVDALLLEPRLHDRKHPKRTCADSLHLWDAAAWATVKLAGTPGRHVLLIVSDGIDADSRTSFEQLHDLAERTATAVFSIPESLHPARPRTFSQSMDSLTAATGGVVLQPLRDFPAARLAAFVDMLRQRYILEFLRPANFRDRGEHSLDIEVLHGSPIIRATGTAAPLVDRERLLDPSTISDDGNQGGALAPPPPNPPR